MQPIKVNYTGTPEGYPYYLTMDGYVFNSANSTETGICANTYTPHDAGNQTAIKEEGDFDPTEALEIISNYVAKQPVVFEAQLPTGASLLGACFFRIFWVTTIFPYHRTIQFLLGCYPVSWLLVSVFNCVMLYAVLKKLFRRKPDMSRMTLFP